MRFARIYIIIGVVLLLASCGQQHKSESVVSDFMQENLKDPSLLGYVDFAKLDSTTLLNDSLLNVMRTKAKSPIYKNVMKYGDGSVGKKLFRLRANYKHGDKDYSTTFYLDEGLNGVLGVKND